MPDGDALARAQAALGELKTNPVLRQWQERNQGFWKDLLPLLPRNPLAVTDVQPRQGYPGTVLELTGAGFGEAGTPLQVSVGGVPATVVEHTPVWLRVLTGTQTKAGSVVVSDGTHSATSPVGFTLGAPISYFDDGPPVVVQGQGASGDEGLSKQGTLNIFVALVTPTGLTAVPADIRQNIVSQWTSAATYYNQASYGKCQLAPTVAATWAPLSGALADYYRDEDRDKDGNVVLDEKGNIKYYSNFWDGDRLAAEAVSTYQSALDGLAPNGQPYDMLAVCCYLDGHFCRAWGNMQASTFATSNTNPALSVTLKREIPYILVGEIANWGRLAHETGHNIVDPIFAKGAVLGEDIYDSDLIDGSVATAQNFDIMGRHDTHPLFSGFHLENLGWLTDNNAASPNADNSSLAGLTNIRRVQWDRNPRTMDVELVAHGLTQNATQGRYHVFKLIITPSLAYYVEVRQQPGTTTQVFDEQIPVGTAPNLGGVIVTRVLTDTVNNNQQTRFITLAHDPGVLGKGQQVVDPLRGLTITVLEDSVQARPQVCRVRVAWAQAVANDPKGRFDLRISPTNANFETPDIWVDRAPMGSFTNPLDGEGRPTGSGDKPLVGALNSFICRVHNDGVDPTQNALATFYSISPPGVGDNGAWAPLKTVTIANVPAGGFFDAAVNWVPLVGQHTCLKVAVSQQLGEITGGNNQAQENIFDFDMPSSSPVEPVLLPIAIRNPSPRRERIHVRVSLRGRGLDGYVVALPHQWVWVEGHGERILNLLVMAPADVERYLGRPAAQVRVAGFLERRYSQAPAGGHQPGEYFTPIGGLTARCKPKRRGTVVLFAERKGDTWVVGGRVSPPEPTQTILLLARQPDGDLLLERVTATNGSFRTLLTRDVVLRRQPTLRGLTLNLIAVLVDSPVVAETTSAPVTISL